MIEAIQPTDIVAVEKVIYIYMQGGGKWYTLGKYCFYIYICIKTITLIKYHNEVNMNLWNSSILLADTVIVSNFNDNITKYSCDPDVIMSDKDMLKIRLEKSKYTVTRDVLQIVYATEDMGNENIEGWEAFFFFFYNRRFIEKCTWSGKDMSLLGSRRKKSQGQVKQWRSYRGDWIAKWLVVAEHRVQAGEYTHRP